MFVLLWSTGFIGARAVRADVEPLWFLAFRFAAVAVLVALLAIVLRTAWPGWRLMGHSAVVGALLHGVYLGGVFASVHAGLPTGVSALVVGLQPVLSACVVGPLLGERVTRVQSSGLALGLAGIALVLTSTLSLAGVTVGAAALSFLALGGVTVGTLYQRRFCTGVPVWSGATGQYLAGTVVVLVGALAFEPYRLVWSGRVVLSLAWLVVGLSIGAVALLMVLLRRASTTRTLSLLYLVPPLAAAEAWWVFDETLRPLALVGMIVAAGGVALTQRR